MEHWRKWLPVRFGQIPEMERDRFFEDLGEQVQERVLELAATLAGEDPPNEDYLEKVGRLNMAKLSAEEKVLKEMVLLSPDEDETPPATTQA